MGKILRRLIRSHWIRISTDIIIVAMMTGCSLPPKPDNEQIWQTIVTYQALQLDPPAIIRDGMQVPQRSFGRAGAVLWTQDHRIQRNYQIRYEKPENTFTVISCETLELGADGVYRRID